MERRGFLKTVAALIGGSAVAGEVLAEDSQLEPGTWYDATVQDVTDGDTMTVTLDSDGTEYEVRHLGLDTPETKSNSRYEEVREWEGIEDDTYLANWGENAKQYAQNEFPQGTAVRIAVDEREDEIDPFGRLLAYVRYDKSGDGSFDTLYNEDVVRQGYARVYSSSLTKHDQIWQAEHEAQASGRKVWQQSDPANTSEVNNDPVSEVYFPNVSSVRTDSGAISSSRVPVFAESTAYQNLNSGAVDYSDIPLVGLDESSNVALIGGLFIDESKESDAVGQHQVFLSNLVDYLSSKTGKVLVEGGHRQFNASNALSCEDTVVYQRFLEGTGVALEGINSLDGLGDNALSTARGIIVTNPPLSFSTGEVDALSNYVSNGGAVILMGSASASSTARSNLDSLAADLGSDLRLNADQVYDDSNNAGQSSFPTTTVFDTSYPLFDSYTPDTSSNSSPSCSIASPGDGATVSGTVTVQVSASDSEDSDDSLTVEVAIDGGTWQTATYNSTSGYYEYDWDSTTVSDGDHTIDARATDSGGATTSAGQVTVTVDNVANAPAVDSLSLSEVETGDSDAEFDADWSVSDADGDLDAVDLTLTQDSDGTTEDTATVSVSGSSASGTTRLVAAGDDGTGNGYTVELVVSDSGGNSTSATASATESEGRDVLNADPSTENTASYHTWTLPDPAFSGDINTISVDYPSGTSLDGLDETNVSAFVDSDGDGTAEEVRVNSDTYSGSSDTFDLDGRYDTTVNGEVRLEIDGVTNPSKGDYLATITLSGDDSLSVDAEYVVTASGLAVSTGSASNVTESSATLSGSLDDLGGASSADVYFEYGQSGTTLDQTTSAQTLSSTGNFSVDVTGLSTGTSYDFRAVADASDGDSDTGTTGSFATDTAIAVSTGSASNVGTSSATLNGSLDDLGGASSADVYFQYGQSGTTLDSTTGTKTLSSTGSFSIDVSGLSSGTDYDFRAVADGSDGDSDAGTTSTLTTDSSSGGDTAPTVDAYSVTEAGSPNPHAEITADWTVGDADGDLSSVVVEVFDSSGGLVDSATTSVGGSSASGSDFFKIKKVNGQTFDVTLTVTDGNGNAASATRSVTE